MGSTDDFSIAKMEDSFSNLKVSLRKHLKSAGHNQRMKEKQGREAVETREEVRSKKLDITIGGMVYHLIFHARPDRDLPHLIYLCKERWC